MLDAALAAALLCGLYRAVRLRHAIAAAIALLLIYALVMDAANARAAMTGTVEESLGVLLLGPSALGERARGTMPTLDPFVQFPGVLHAAMAMAALVSVRVLDRESNRLRPESQRARRLDGAASPMLFFGVMKLVSIVARVLMARLG